MATEWQEVKLGNASNGSSTLPASPYYLVVQERNPYNGRMYYYCRQVTCMYRRRGANMEYKLSFDAHYSTISGAFSITVDGVKKSGNAKGSVELGPWVVENRSHDPEETIAAPFSWDWYGGDSGHVSKQGSQRSATLHLPVIPMRGTVHFRETDALKEGRVHFHNGGAWHESIGVFKWKDGAWKESV